jgi:hypothetical protein
MAHVLRTARTPFIVIVRCSLGLGGSKGCAWPICARCTCRGCPACTCGGRRRSGLAAQDIHTLHISRGSVRVLIRAVEKLQGGNGDPPVGFERWVGVHEPPRGVVSEFVFEDDEAGGLGAWRGRLSLREYMSMEEMCIPAYHPLMAASTLGRVVCPVDMLQSSELSTKCISTSCTSLFSGPHALVIPINLRDPKDLPGDGSDAVVRVSHRRAPVAGDTAACGIVDDLHGPSQLSQDLSVVPCRHVGMCPCVDWCERQYRKSARM